MLLVNVINNLLKVDHILTSDFQSDIANIRFLEKKNQYLAY